VRQLPFDDGLVAKSKKEGNKTKQNNLINFREATVETAPTPSVHLAGSSPSWYYSKDVICF
jgi:hypothetical protein